MAATRSDPAHGPEPQHDRPRGARPPTPGAEQRSDVPGGARRLLDKPGSAHYLNTSEDTVERLIHTGQLPVVVLPAGRDKRSGRARVGACRRVLIDVHDLDALIERSKERKG